MDVLSLIVSPFQCGFASLVKQCTKRRRPKARYPCFPAVPDEELKRETGRGHTKMDDEKDTGQLTGSLVGRQVWRYVGESGASSADDSFDPHINPNAADKPLSGIHVRRSFGDIKVDYSYTE
ncbi:unnamed protein product [Vitrella brassicaformis CCMP3155]|uniref:Uncharacterized protein n=1 Tax=Vitrella brassicaformis (strain CCMP3155) TaxID=1169540 RepID=A0A0G4EMG0_VITBC|nr:unnamed protein product [Vitrella brassicaformis CCMP3155]|eukprot:CEL98153.1 unnamed protein product [Vitrella brassicaformis CCMP3155]